MSTNNTILFLHGMGQSKDVFGRLIKNLSSKWESWEYIAIDAPFMVLESEKRRFSGYLNLEPEKLFIKTSLEERNWFGPSAATCEGIKVIKQAYLRENTTVDCVVGFSQGAYMASFLSFSCQKNAHYNWWKPKCLVLIGFMGPIELEGICDLPCFHFVGKHDKIAQLSDNKLASKFSQYFLIEHNGGHIIPSDAMKYSPVFHFLEQAIRMK